MGDVDGTGLSPSKANITSNSTDVPSDITSRKSDLGSLLTENSAMIKRALYVTVAVTAIVLLYFVLRLVRARRSKSRRYGPLINSHENMEMNQLTSDSEEDVTMFDANVASRKNLIG